MFRKDKTQETIVIERKSRALEEQFEEIWDIKKIIIGVFTLGVVITSIILAKKYLAPAYKVQNSSANVKGVQTQITNPPVSSTNSSSLSIESLQQQVQHVNVNDIAKSSPQIQQILHQIEALPLTKAKEACIQLCNKL